MLASYATFNGLAPSGGPKSIAYTFDFTNVASVPIDLFGESTMSDFGGAQAVYIDNSTNPFCFTLTVLITGQNVICPPFSQAVLPLYTTSELRVQASVPAVGVKVPVVFLNVPMSACVWPANCAQNIFYLSNSAATVNATLVASGPRSLSMITGKIATTLNYLKLFDTAGVPNVGVDVPIFSTAITPSSAGSVTIMNFPLGLVFTKGIGMAITLNAPQLDTTAATSQAIALSLIYR